MGDVVNPLTPWLERIAAAPAPPTDHSMAAKFGAFGERAMCMTCATVLTYTPGPFVVTGWVDDAHTTKDWERVATGYWEGPPDDPIDHRIPIWPPGDQPDQPDDNANDNSDPAPSPRPAGISAAAAAKGRSRDTPSRSPEARHEEYVRAKRRAAGRARL